MTIIYEVERRNISMLMILQRQTLLTFFKKLWTVETFVEMMLHTMKKIALGKSSLITQKCFNHPFNSVGTLGT